MDDPASASRQMRKHSTKANIVANFDPEEPDCMTLVLMGEHIDPAELAELSDAGYTNLLLLTTGAGAVCNTILSVGKIGAGVMFHSKALLADGIHSFSDLISDIAAGVAGYMAGRKADASMPWGYGKCEALGTLWVALMLLLAAGSLIYHLYQHFKEVLGGDVEFVEVPAIFVAVVSTVIKELAFQGTYRVGTKINSQVLIANAWHHRSDALSSVAALVGVIVARAGWLWADAAAGVIVTLLLCKVGFDVLIEAVAALVDKSICEEVQEDVSACLSTLKQDKQLQGHMTTFRARNMGRKKTLDITLNFPPDMSISTITDQVDVMRNALKKKVPNCGEVVVQVKSGPDLGDFMPSLKNPKSAEAPKPIPMQMV